MPTVFVSEAIHQERLVFNQAQVSISLPHRGWKALSALYRASLCACGYRVESVVRPEIYQTEWAQHVKGVAKDDWHFAVKPIHHIRPFHGIANAFVCDWPFSTLSDAYLGGFPFFNQVALLKKADAVVCCTEFTTQTLRSAGVDRAITLPPCVIPHPPKSAAVGTRGKWQTFLTVADIDHLPRQLGNTIEGFLQAQAQRNDLRLLVCLQGSAQAPSDVLQHQVSQKSGPLRNNAVSFVAAGFGQTSVARLLLTADFFLCASSAEGLPLPMIEAMFTGVPLVTTMNAGIGSFLPGEAAIPIKTMPAVAPAAFEPIAAHMHLTHYPPTPDGLRDAILGAAALDTTVRSSMVAMCREIAENHFGFAAFETGLRRLGELISIKRS